jgi:hypothetical protein
MAGCGQDLMYDRRRCCTSRALDSGALWLQALVLSVRKPALALGTLPAAGAGALQPRLRHTEYFIGDEIRFLLVDVFRSADLELCLKPKGSAIYRAPIKVGEDRCGRPIGGAFERWPIRRKERNFAKIP